MGDGVGRVLYDYRAARDRIFGLIRDEKGKVKEIVSSKATMSERVLLLALVEFAPNIEPSVKSLALMVGTDERSVRRLLLTCKKKKLLMVEHHPGKRSRYTITCNPGLKVTPDEESSHPGPKATSTPDLKPAKADNEAGNEAGTETGASKHDGLYIAALNAVPEALGRPRKAAGNRRR